MADEESERSPQIAGRPPTVSDQAPLWRSRSALLPDISWLAGGRKHAAA